MLKHLLFVAATVLVVVPIPGRCLTLADFKFLDLMGVGQSGEVYSVRKIDDNRLYALKLINVTDGHRDFSRKFYLGSYAQSLVDELEVSKNVLNDCDFAVHVYYAFTEGECAIMIMDYVPKGSISSRLQKRKDITMGVIKGGYQVTKHLNEQVAKKTLPSVLTIVEQMHSRGLLHGDLAIANFLVTSRGTLILSDFETTRPFQWKKSIVWKFMKWPPTIHQTNMDYSQVADIWSDLAGTKIARDNVYYRISKTDRKSVAKLREHEFFAGPEAVDWEAVDRGIPVFDAEDFNPDTYVGDENFWKIPTCKGTLSDRDLKTLSVYDYTSPLLEKPPRVL